MRRAKDIVMLFGLYLLLYAAIGVHISWPRAVAIGIVVALFREEAARLQ